MVEKGVMWKGIQRHVQMMDNNKIGEFKHSPPPQKKKEKKRKTGKKKISVSVNTSTNTNGNNNNKGQQGKQQALHY